MSEELWKERYEKLYSQVQEIGALLIFELNLGNPRRPKVLNNIIDMIHKALERE